MKNSSSFPLLAGLKVVELEGYLPISFLGKALHDFGADVFLIKKPHDNEVMKVLSYLHDGKKSITLDLKDEKQIKIFKKMLHKADILIDGYRPGILEKMDLDPKELVHENSRLIVVRVSGYGQEGLMHEQPGHEINYLSLAGTLDFFKNENNKIINPQIIMGDLFCGSLMPIYHISQALVNRKLNGHGCIIDSSITTNLLSLSALANKFVDKQKFYFSCVSKNYEYILFYLTRDDKIEHNLKKICERLIIEVLNVDDVSEGHRLSITRDYIDFFQLITKSVADSVKYIKELCKTLTKNDIIKNFKKAKYVEVYPVLQYKDLIPFFKQANLMKNDNIISPFNVELINTEGKKLKKNDIELETDVVEVLKTLEISHEELENYIKSNKDLLKPKF